MAEMATLWPLYTSSLFPDLSPVGFSERWHLCYGVVRGLSTKKPLQLLPAPLQTPCDVTSRAVFPCFSHFVPVTFQIFGSHLVVTGGGAHRKQISRGDFESQIHFSVRILYVETL